MIVQKNSQQTKVLKDIGNYELRINLTLVNAHSFCETFFSLKVMCTRLNRGFKNI